MTFLLVGDPHLTDRARDAYRFGLFKWIKKQQEIHHPKATYIMGDLTDQKDRHSSILVNRTVDELTDLHPPVYIIMGNHDYVDPNNPFFKFLNCIPGVFFIIAPVMKDKVLMIPHYRTEDELEHALQPFEGSKIDLVLCHNTFAGAKAEHGTALTGFSASPVEHLNPRLGIYAGDVHGPQRAGSVTYVGAPYHVRFGDDYTPRVLLVRDGKKDVNLHFDAPHKFKLTIREADDLIRNKELLEGDQVKVVLELAREEAVEWKSHKQEIITTCKKLGLDIFGIDLKVNTTTPKGRVSISDTPSSRKPKDILAAFSKAENLSSQIRQAGIAFLED